MNFKYGVRNISAGGWLGFLTALTIILSASVEYRLQIGPLYVHAFLLIMPFFWLLLKSDLSVISRESWWYMILFAIFFSAACAFSVADVPHMVKVWSSLITFIFFTQTVRSERDFWFVGLGFTLCAFYLGLKGILISDQFGSSKISTGVVALEGIGNKNAQSLYMLPGLFFSGLAIMRCMRSREYVLLGANVVFIAVIIFGMILSANRSGWVVGLVILLFTFGNAGLKMRTLFYIVILGAAVNYFVEQYAADIVEYKYEQTFVRDYKSDDTRKFLLIESMKLAIEHPFLGLGPVDLERYLGFRAGEIGFRGDRLDPHNVFGYLLGGTGFFSFFFFMRFLYALIRDKGLAIRIREFPHVREVRRILVFFIFIFLLRGVFTREILYSPTFIGSMAIIYSYYQMTKRNYIRWYVRERMLSHDDGKTRERGDANDGTDQRKINQPVV